MLLRELLLRCAAAWAITQKGTVDRLPRSAKLSEVLPTEVNCPTAAIGAM
jgi:hypothetical protein